MVLAMAQYRMNDAGNGKFIISRKRFGLFWVDYDTPARQTYLIEQDMNRLHSKLMKLQESHSEASKRMKDHIKELTDTATFKEEGRSLVWRGPFWPPFRKVMKKPDDIWKSMFPKDELTYDEHLYVGSGDDKFQKQTVFSTADIGGADNSVIWERNKRENKGNQQQQRKKGQQQNQNQRGPEFKLDTQVMIAIKLLSF